MHTVSRKIERLVNLTIALLATKRFLTKEEIFNSVDGYEGSAETKERMFERDKDDLRNLAITIEVGGFDAAFEDEAGYRIKPEGYSLDLGLITGTEVALLSLAAEAWRGAALDDAAQSALTKLRSMGVESDLDAIPSIAPRINTPNADFQGISSAISQRQLIKFSYLSPALELQERTIAPFAIATRNSFWYLAGNDIDKSAVRIFRLDRIDGAIHAMGRGSVYEIPEGFDIFAYLDDRADKRTAILDIRKGKAHLLRNSAVTIVDKTEWDRISITYFDTARLIDLILWHGDDVLVIKPIELRAGVVAALEEIVLKHG